MVTRRQFIKSASLALIGGIIASKIPLAKAEKEAPELPWPYVRLDTEETRKLGHLGYYAFECAGGAFWAIAVQLREKIGYPWTLLPLPTRQEVLRAVSEGRHLHSLMQFGYGGVVGWATTCGALLGAIAIIQMVVGEKSHWSKLGQLLMRWYETTRFPSDKSNDYAINGKFYVPREKMKYAGRLPQSVSFSVLCHVSVSRWCRASGYASGSKERSERCGRLTGDVAAKAVELLNAYFSGGLDAAMASARVTLSANTVSCRVCHYKGKDYEIGQFTRGYLACESCHHDLTPHTHEFLGTAGIKPPEEEASEQKALRRAAAIGAAGAVAAGVVAGILAASGSRKSESGR